MLFGEIVWPEADRAPVEVEPLDCVRASGKSPVTYEAWVTGFRRFTAPHLSWNTKRRRGNLAPLARHVCGQNVTDVLKLMVSIVVLLTLPTEPLSPWTQH